MANASKFLEELEKQKKKRKDEGKDTSSLEPTVTKTLKDKSSSPQVDSFFNALNMEREKLRRRESLSDAFDIAPVKPTVGSVSGGGKHGGGGGSFTVKSEEDDSLLDFFQKGAFSDGYQFGDVSKTILGTVGDIGVGTVKGVMKIGEGLGDAGTYLAAAAADKLGYDDKADAWRKNAQRTAIDDLFAPVDKKLDKYSALGRTLDSTSEAIGQIGGIIATGGLASAAGAGALGATAATTGVMGLSSFGSSTGEAYKGGAETGEAELYGAIAGTADAVTELIFGGLGRAVGAVGLSHGLSSADDILAKKLSEKITNTIAKNAVQFGVKASGEGAEEVLAGLAQAAGKKLTYMSEEELSDIIADENLLEQFVVGAMASGVSQVPSLQQSNKAGTDYITGRTKNEQAVIDRVVEQRIKDAETDAGGKKLTAKQRQAIEEEAAQDMERGRIDIDTIEEALGGEEYKAYQDAVKEEDALRREYQELGALKEPTLAEKTRYEELHGQVSDIFSDERRTTLKSKLSERVAEMAKSDRLSESYAERSRRGEYFTEDVSKYKSEAAKKTVQNLVDSKIANNTNRTREMADTVAKIAEDKGIVFNFTNNQKLRETGKAAGVADGVIINGFKDADGITVNLDSPKAWEFIVGHEVTHALESTAEYTALADAVKVYAQTKGEYDSRRDAIASLYAEGTDVDSELTADMVGEYLFTDEQFVNELSTKHQNVFQKVFAEIKHLVKMVTAGSKEARQLEQVKRTFEKAYRAAQEQQVDAGVQNSLSQDAASDLFDRNRERTDLDRKIREIENSEEYKTQTKNFVDAFLSGDEQAEDKYNQYLAAVGYSELKERRSAVDSEIESLENDLEKQREESERTAIEKSGLTEAEYFRKKAVREFGYTPDFGDAGYITANGKMLNFSGEKGKHFGTRGQDHRAIGNIYENTTGSAAMYRFMRDGNVRVMAGEYPGIDLPTVAEPTREQYATIRRFANEYADKNNFHVDLTDESGHVIGSLSYENRINAAKIISDIKLFYATGEIREQSATGKFHGEQFSLSQDSEGRQLSEGQREYFRESKVTDENGNLKVVYHGSPADFNEFSLAYLGTNGTAEGYGFYFTDKKSIADVYSKGHEGQRDENHKGRLFEVYLDIKKPLSDTEVTMSRAQFKKFLTELNKQVDEDGEPLDVLSNYGDVAWEGLNSVINTAMEIEYDGSDSDVNMVHSIINGVGNLETVLKVLRKTTGYDGIIVEDATWGGDQTIYVAFHPEQIKNVDNLNPTGDPDIRRSLSDASAPVGGRGTAARDLRYQGEDTAPVAAAPVQQAADQFVDADNMVQPEEQIAPIPGEHSELDRLHADYEAARAAFDGLSAQVQEMYPELTPEEQEQAMDAVLAAGERLQDAQDALNAEQQTVLASYTDSDIPPEMEAPYYGEEQQEAAADEFADRDMKSVGKRSVNAYQYDNPEVKPFYQRTAREMLGDLSRTQRGERYMSEDGKWTGASRMTAYDIAALKDEYGVSYADIGKALDAIIEDHGAENYALAKRVEILIHDRLAKGFVDAFTGVEIPPDQDYLALMEQKQSEDSGAEAFAALMADSDSYVPPITEDMAPVAEAAPAADGLSGVSSAVETEVEEIDAPVVDTADIDAAVREIQTTSDKILQKKQNAEAELAAYKEQRAAKSAQYKERLAELRRKLDGKKRKDTKAAVRLGQQISRLERLAADVDADYAKKISDAEKRIARRDFDLQQDHTEADKLERAYAKIDAQLATDRAAVEAEFAQRREELSASIADKNTYVSERAKELYAELSHLKKGVRASYELGYLLDHGYDWRTLKSTLLKVNLQPEGVINPDSAEESVIREMLNEEYASRTFELGELDGEMQDRLAELEADAEAQKAEVRKSEQQLHRKQVEARYMDEMKGAFAVGGYDLDVILRTAKDVPGWTTVDKTPQRVNYAVFGDEAGEIMNDLTVNRVAQNETEGIRWLNRYTDPKTGEIARISKQYNIKPGSKESAAAQMYAEGFYVDEYNEIVKYGDRELAADFPDANVQANIKGLARDGRIRAIYDATLDAINEVRVRNGYPEIPKRDNYFLHFREMGDFFSKNGLPFNPNDMRLKDLPTDINGMTVDNKPGKPYFASEKQRKGKRTSFDLLGGLEQYLTSAKDQIYHIDDIQRHRALRNYIADDYGQAKGLDSLAGLSEEEVQERIQLVFGNHLSAYAKFLNEEANILAGKTALMDRALEGVIGRRGMTFMSDLNKQVGANQVGFNVSSSLTNLLSGVQAFSKMNKGAFIKGFAQTVSNRVGGIFGRGDNFTQESPVMVRREGAKRFKTNWWQRRQDNAYALMGAVDSVTTEVIARAKYAELTGKGMSSEQAHYETDKWVSALMGDRSLGQQPHLFNSKTFGMILKYQLEVRNQLDSMFADTIREAKLSTAQIEDVKKRNAVKAAKIASTFATLAVTQHIFGQVFESIAGYNPAFDIIEAIIKAAGWDDDEDDDDTVLDNLEQGLLSLAEDMPYYSILSGGRIPIESALPVETLIKGKDSYGNEVNRWKTAAETLPYYVLPGGYGQIKKTMQGLSMYSDEHPVAGSYTDSGNLRFPVGTDPLDKAQAAVFGQWSSGNARDYFDDERKPLSEKQINEYAAADMTIQDYWRYRDGLKEHSGLPAQAEYINSLDIPTWKKNLFINNISERKEAIDMTDFDKYGSLDEMDFAKKYPEKYKLLQEQGVSYYQYETFDKKTKEAYQFAVESPEKYNFIRDIGYTLDDYAKATDTEKDAWTWAYNNPDKYLVSRAVSDDLFTYRSYADALNDIKADKDDEGKSISGSRKEKVVEYINGLDLDYGAKVILLKQEYPAEDAYNNDIIDYLNERDDISGDDMVVMLTALGFKVSEDGTVTWD